ncbi:Hpt domain-containing protein [Bacteriovorax sp. Seq25_V]|uniref:Hpt domain-containing protein n=1 Tax=Bacteriovorax sp. Seq25_V TaxID=1201288 RepID=UPI000389E0CA|nr:Hpt domain-containing protein [Bacteriovorax sp. Seq25_V]EQC43942.1 Hpt domain protein [Bacteriovorax sp. Seq25_V]
MPIIEVDEELKDILPSFLENRRKDIGLLNDAFAVKDYSTIEKIGHRVSGSSGGYGFDELGKIAKNIELECKNGNFEKVGDLIKNFEAFMQDIQVKFI